MVAEYGAAAREHRRYRCRHLHAPYDVEGQRTRGRVQRPFDCNRDSKKRYRADVLIEDQIAKYEEKINKEIAKAAKKFGDSFDEQKFRETNPRVLEHQQKRDALHQRYSDAMNASDLNELKQIILDEGIVCPISGTHNWTDVRQFNLMFKTEVGSTAEGLPLFTCVRKPPKASS